MKGIRSAQRNRIGMSSGSSPRQLADQFAALLYPPRVADEDVDHAALVRGLGLGEELRRSTGANLPATDHAALAEAAVHLYNLLATRRSGSMPKIAVSGLLRLGRPGWLMTRRLLLRGTLGTEAVGPLLESLPPHCGLGLLQVCLSGPKPPSKQLLPWVEPLAKKLCSRPLDEVVPFFLELEAEQDSLAPVLGAALRHDSLLQELQQGLESPQGDPAAVWDLSAICIRHLKASTLVPTLANALLHPAIPTSAQRITQLARTAGPGNTAAIKTLQQIIRRGAAATIPACIAALAQLSWPGTGRLAARLHCKSKRLARALAVVASQLPPAAYQQYLHHLPEAERPVLEAGVVRASSRVQPAFVQTRTRTDRTLPKESQRQLQSTFSAQHGPFPDARQAVPEPATGPIRTQRGSGLLSRLLPTKKNSLADLLERSHSPRDKSLPGSELRNAALTGRTLTNLNLSGSYLEQTQFIRTNFSGMDFSNATFLEADFTGCTFTNCKLRHTRLHRTAFQNCSFNRCDFTGTVLSECSLRESDMERCFLTNALLSDTRLEHTRLRSSALGQCRFQGGSAHSLLLRNTTLTRNIWSDASLHGLLWHRCTLREEVFASTRFKSVALRHSSVARCRVLGLSSGVGLLDQSELQEQQILITNMAAEQLSAADVQPAPPPQSGPFLRRTTALWVRLQDIRRREARMRINNERRIAWANATLQDCPFLHLVPCLLSDRRFEQALGLSDIPACRVAGYVPDPETLALARQYFPKDPKPPVADPSVAIASLSTIGSIGSVAQTKTSDADFWVCHDHAADPQALNGLRRKLDALSRWAEEAFELEVHFFLMSLDAVKNNQFGFSDKESSGTAQALMLKEEFYRTAVILAGRIPGWWLTTPGCSPKAYHAQLAAAASDPMGNPDRYMDAGYAARIPAGEFFGAALWQIVKGIDSPFKSVLKLGLLERYAQENNQGPLLCDQLKAAISDGHPSCFNDPYAALALAVRNHYQAAGNTEAVRLLLQALSLKTDAQNIPRMMGHPFTCEHQHLARLLRSTDTTPDRAAPSFVRALHLGDNVSRYMINTYKRIRSTPLAKTKANAIAPADLTRLARRIAVNYAPKKYKVPRVPILGIRKGHFVELRLSAHKEPGKLPVWAISGKAGSQGRTTSPKNEILTRSTNPVQMLAWLVINGLYSSEALLHADRSIAPLSTPDVRNVLEQMSEFLTPPPFFHVEPDEFLREEHAARIYLLPNFTATPETDKLTQLTAVYATNWGELFCMPLPNVEKARKQGLQTYLRSTLPHEQPPQLEIKVYYPKGSQCPRLSLI